MESGSERQRMANPRKSYPVDPGLIPIFDRIGCPNTGHSLETAVPIERQRRCRALAYVRTPSGCEVEFLARDAQGNEELIQVCSDASDPESASRELRALQEAAEQHPHAQQRLLALSGDRAPDQAPAAVIVQPADEWMLTDPENG